MTTPEAVHLGRDDLPYVDIGDGSKLRVLQVKPKEGLWVVENIFQAGADCAPETRRKKMAKFLTTSSATTSTLIRLKEIKMFLISKIW